MSCRFQGTTFANKDRVRLHLKKRMADVQQEEETVGVEPILVVPARKPTATAKPAVDAIAATEQPAAAAAAAPQPQQQHQKNAGGGGGTAKALLEKL